MRDAQIATYEWLQTSNPLPRLNEEEFERLKLDIEANGVLDPVERCTVCNALLDGFHRLEISQQLGVEWPTKTVELPVCSPEAHWAYAWKRNMTRRQLSDADERTWREQRKHKALSLREQGLTQAQVAALVGVSQGRIAQWESESVSVISPNNPNTSTDNRRKLTDHDIAYIIERLAAGDTQQSIADSLAESVTVDRSRIAQIASQYADKITEIKIARLPLPCTVQGVEIRHGDARDHNTNDLADLAFFSPPYNVGIDYDGDETGDGLSDGEWQTLVRETMEVLRDGWQVGRIIINVPAALDRNPYRPVTLPIVDRLTLEGVIVWDKGTTGNRTSWGSWRLPTEPRLRDRTERLYVYRTDHPLRNVEHGLKPDDNGRMVSKLLSSADFTTLTQDVWTIPPESAQRVKHPAPFPAKLAENVIRLFGWEGCTVIDPFGGSGSTGVAAVHMGCKAIVIDRSETYCRLAIKRLMEGWGK